MTKRFPINPAHPERICWGCDRYCPTDALMCGNGSLATPHPSELFGEDWMTWGLGAPESTDPPENAAKDSSGDSPPRPPA